MALGISSIGSVGSIPPPVSQDFQNNVQNPTQNPNGAVPPVNGIGTFNPPSNLQPAPTVGQGLGGNVGNTGNAQGQGSLTDTLAFNNQPTHTFAMWGQEFFFNPQFQDKKEAVAKNGEKVGDETSKYIMEHEEAHRLTAQLHGVPTGPSVVTWGADELPDGGHVKLKTRGEFDPQLALSQGQSYLDETKRHNEGLIASAEAPASANIPYGYGELSQADKDIAAMGRANLAQVAAFEATNQGQALTAVKEKPSQAAQEQLAMIGSHPDLLQAFQNGIIS
ncbi:MAG: hypothetical protein ACK5T0_00300 [Vampirovibrionales bacterium]